MLQFPSLNQRCCISQEKSPFLKEPVGLKIIPVNYFNLYILFSMNYFWSGELSNLQLIRILFLPDRKLFLCPVIQVLGQKQRESFPYILTFSRMCKSFCCRLGGRVLVPHFRSFCDLCVYDIMSGNMFWPYEIL